MVLKSKLQNYSKTKITLKLGFSESSCNFFNQDFVWPPLLSIQAIIRLRIDLTLRKIIASVMLFHS